MSISHQKDFVSGLIFTLVGSAFAWGATSYEVGEANRMGPGYFPLVLGVLLALLGLVITVKAVIGPRHPDGPIGSFAFKPLVLVIGAVVAFGVLLQGIPAIGLPPMGLMVAIVVQVCIAAMAGEGFKWRETLVLALILAVSSYLVFIQLLGLAFSPWPTWAA